MKRFTIFAAMLLLSLAVKAQEREWNLQQCIEYAIENNISVKQSEISVEQKEIALSNSINSRLPGVSAGAGQNFSFGRGLTADNTYANTNTTSTSFSIGADMTVFNGFRTKYEIARGRLDLETATSELEKAKDDIRVAVAQAYVQILYNMEILDVAANQVSIDEMQVNRIESLLANGKASQVELSAQKATLAQSRLSQVQAANNLSLSLLELTQLLELPSPEGFNVQRPAIDRLQTQLLPSPELIYEEALGIKASVKAEELKLENARLGIERAKGAYLPTLSLNGGLGTNYYTSSGFESNPFLSQMKNNFSQYLGMNLSIPIFSRYQTRNQIRSSRLSYDSQALQLDLTKKNLFKEIQQAYYNALASEEKYRSSEQAEQSARDAFEQVTAKFENGKASITEYNESKGRYVSAASDLAQARYQYLYQTRLLDFYRGAEMAF